MTGLRLVSSSAHWLFQARYTGYLDNKGPFITSEAVTTLGALSPEIILPKASLSSTFIDLSSLLVDGKRVDPCQKPWITHQFQGQRKSKGLMVSVCVLRGFTLKLLHFNSSVSWEEELSAGEWGTEIAMSCAGCKKSCVCRGFDLSVCVCACVWTKACISLIVRNNPPQPSSTNASIPTLTTTTKWEHTQHIRAYILCVSICVWGLFCFISHNTEWNHSKLCRKPSVLAEKWPLFSDAEDAKLLRNRADRTNLI